LFEFGFLMVLLELVLFVVGVGVGLVDQRESDHNVDEDNANHDKGDDDERSHPSGLAVSPRPVLEFLVGVEEVGITGPELVVLGADGGGEVVLVGDVVGGVEGEEDTTVGVVSIEGTDEGEHTNDQEGEEGLERSGGEDGSVVSKEMSMTYEVHRCT
jgi:hypothetical protein